MKLKCPVCGSVLEFERTSALIRCESCDSKFNGQKILQKYEEQKLTIEKATSAENKKQKSSLVEEKPRSALLKNQRRKRAQFWVILGFSLVSLVLVVAIVLVLQANMSKPVAPLNDENAVQENMQENGELEPVENLPELPTIENEPEPRVPFAMLDQPDEVADRPPNRFKSKQLMDRCWFDVKPYLVELYAETPTGPQTATGIVVDSRGWVATSFSAIKGAAEIHLRPAVDSAREEAERIDDKVRGYVAIKPEHDLVLLSVNRRLIDTFADLGFDPVTRLAASQYVIQCQSPTQRFPYSSMETRVEAAGTLELLDSKIQKRLKWKEMDESVRWLVHQNRSPLKPGAPLVDDKGQVVAINTGVFDADQPTTVALPAEYILELKKRVENEVLPLPVGPVAGGVADNTETGAVLPIASPSREMSEKLNYWGEQCDAFGWYPESNEDWIALNEFASALVQSKRSLANDDPAEMAIVGSQIKQWEQTMARQLGIAGELTKEEQGEFNQRSLTVRNADEPFLVFAFVSHAAMNLNKIAIAGDEPKEAVGFEFKGAAEKMIVNTDPEWPPMPPDSSWLILATQTSGGRVRLVQPDGGAVQLLMGQVYFVHQAN